MKTSLLILIPAISGLITFKSDLFKVNHRSISSSAIPHNNAAIVSGLTNNIEYNSAQASIRANNFNSLNKLAKYLIDNKYPLALRGYADSIGGFKANWKLSEERAITVKKYLVKMGVEENKIITTPFGSTKPIASNKTVSGRQRNRRVEIKISHL